jgi:hypothetical protein
MRKIAFGIIKCYDMMDARRNQLIDTHIAHIKEIEDIITSKNITINRLKERVQYYASDPTRNLRE